MTPIERVTIALKGGHSDVVPFTAYENKLVPCGAERHIRNRGLCIVDRRIQVVRTHTPNVQTRSESFVQGGKHMTRTCYQTPVGTLSTLVESAGVTSLGWRHEKLFKTPDDYKALLFLLRDEQYELNYEAFAKAQADSGGDCIYRPDFGLEPMQALISGVLMDMEDFCVQWMENRDEILTLYQAIVENRRKIYPLVAQSPAGHANYGGNVTPQIIGLENFRKYWVPHYNEAAEVMHRHGKLIGCHFDGDCRLLSRAIGESALDYVEAFTPAPGTDMTMSEARAVWPNKVIWLNFPSALHLKTDDEVEQFTVDMLDQLSSIDGILVGITEDVPESRWRSSFAAIMDGLSRHASTRAALYH